MSAKRISELYAEDVRAEFTSDIEVIGVNGIHTLRVARDPDANAARRELIERIRGGAHAELIVRATTFRQKDGHPNRRYLRHNPARLGDLAESYRSMPVLVDHNTFEQSARIGTIVESELSSHGGTGWASFRQGLHIVKPLSVISVLDGTLDRFSIGWRLAAGGVITCSVHGAPVFSADGCRCRLGQTITVDGKPKIVEYEFSKAEGTEVSAVNVPAVLGTRIEDVQTALAAELHHDEGKESQPMQFSRLAAALGLAALTAADEDRALAAVESLRRERDAAVLERDTARTSLQAATIKAAVAEQLAAKATEGVVDGILTDAYKAGKLVYSRDASGKAVASPIEAMLRDYSKSSAGVDGLRAMIESMPKIVPTGTVVLSDKVEETARTNVSLAGVGVVDANALASVAAQLGLTADEIKASAKELGYQVEG